MASSNSISSSVSTADRTAHNQVMFFTFGMFIIAQLIPISRWVSSPRPITYPTTTTKPLTTATIPDTIEFLPSSSSQLSRPSKHDLPGGAGLYALLGARLLSPPLHSRSLSWLLDAGSDFPASITTQIQSWQTSTVIRHDDTRLTTRAWNGYGNDDLRSFKYTTPKKRLDVEDLSDEVVRGSGWHLVCGAQRCVDVLGKLERRRKDGRDGRKVVVWEPIPDLCSPEERDGVTSAAGCVDVVSPNAEELRAFFGVDGNGVGQDELVVRLMGWGEEGRKGAWKTACVVREGRLGSTVYFAPGERVVDVPGQLKKIHLPAYHDQSMAGEVIDPTGGGNTYLGALALAMASLCLPEPESSNARPQPIEKTCRYISDRFLSFSVQIPQEQSDLLIAAICACVAAGFAIEQYGVPNLQTVVDPESGESLDLWNDCLVNDRIGKYLMREHDRIKAQLSQFE